MALIAFFLIVALGFAQSATPAEPQDSSPPPLDSIGPGLTTSVWQWKGLTVDSISFGGVTFNNADLILSELDQKAGAPLAPEKVRSSLRRLYDTGRYGTIEVRGVRQDDRVKLVFYGRPLSFVGRVSIAGVSNERLTSLLVFATRLRPGAVLTEGAAEAGTDGIKQALEQQGYFESQATVATTPDAVNNQMNLTYTVRLGPLARIGQVILRGDDPGMTVEEFRRKGRLRNNSRVSRDTVSNALSRLRREFQRRNRLEATVSLQSQTYSAQRRQVDYVFLANQGPEVRVVVEGTAISRSRLRLLVPIFEEAAIDNDLLNEGARNIRDFVQQQGYFDAQVSFKVTGADAEPRSVIFTVDRGMRRKVLSVNIAGNRYFSDDLLRERLKVRKADAYVHNGRFSASLMAADAS
ncbi:MAG: outer membrane protein assembly factor, partial [Acidobacteriaceae bacterium]|nr:outer membrane protein assembly factor [Acidobacteriaceae bacterium]